MPGVGTAEDQYQPSPPPKTIFSAREIAVNAVSQAVVPIVETVVNQSRFFLELGCKSCGGFFTSPVRFLSSEMFLQKDPVFRNLVVRCSHCNVPGRWEEFGKRWHSPAGVQELREQHDHMVT